MSSPLLPLSISISADSYDLLPPEGRTPQGSKQVSGTAAAPSAHLYAEEPPSPNTRGGKR